MQPLLDAFSLGGTYALAALGLGLVFGVLKLVNFAHAELITISAYIMVITNALPLVISFILAAFTATVLAIITELAVYRRLRGTGPAIMLIASFGLSVGLQKSYELIFGALPRSAAVAPWMTGSVEIAGLNVTISSLVTVALTVLILLAMGYLVDFTTLGLQLRAASSDFKTARLLGVRSNLLITSSFAISGLLAAFVGFIIVVENPQVEPMFGLNITILALVGIVIGGISSLRGCALGGFIVGFILSILNTFLGNARVYAYSYLFLAVVIILLVRPGGILSKQNEMERV